MTPESEFNSTKINPLTVKQLRDWLDDQEEAWTGMDEKYMGKFEDQTVVTDFWKSNGNHEFKYSGIGPASTSMQMIELGVWIGCPWKEITGETS